MAGKHDDDPFGDFLPGDDPSMTFDDGDDPGVSLAEAFGIPDRLPPMRLPDPAELAESARSSRMLRQVRDLASWVGEGRELTAEEELSAADTLAAAAALGLAVPDVSGSPSVRELRDVPELLRLWRLAEALDLVEVCTDHVHIGEDLESWDGWDDEEILDLWAGAVGFLCAASLPLDAELAPVPSLDFEDAGVLMLILLFMAGREGVERAELRELVRESATEGMSPSEAEEAWKAWLSSQGEAADALLARLAELGAIDGDGKPDPVRLTPLAAWTVREQLVDSGVEIPLLPPAAEMTAADLLAGAGGLTEADLAAETAAWLGLRTPEAAASELLDTAATSEPPERMLAVAIATELGPAAEESWQEALTRVELRPYAKMALANIADPGSSPESGFEPELADVAWLLTDVLAAAEDEPEAGVVDQFRQAVPPGEEEAIFDAMWRQPHPAAHEVLTLLGRELPDKNLAKSARRAAFKAANHGPR